MHIESFSTGERRTRMLIFLTMCTVFSAWFAYDGWKGWPKANLASAMKEMPKETPSGLKINPQVTAQQLTNIQQHLTRKEPVTQTDLTAMLGEPAWEQNEELTYTGSQWTAITRLAKDKVVSVTSAPAENPTPPENTNYLVRPDRLGRVQAGMSREELRELLGKPSKTQEKTLWYIGPASVAAFPIAGDKVVGEPMIHKNQDHSESDLFMQKVLAIMLGIGAIFLAIKFVRVLTLNIVLDDDGLHVNNTRIAWDAMTQLKTDDYLNKGWVDLVYKNGDRVQQFRLDSYHISRFKELVQALCERKGFVLPTVAETTKNVP